MRKNITVITAVLFAAMTISGCAQDKASGSNEPEVAEVTDVTAVTDVTHIPETSSMSAAVGITTSDTAADEPVSDVPLPDDGRIFLVSEYSNYAWGYQDNGVFLDTNGDVYRFEFGGYAPESSMTFGECLELFRKNGSPILHIDEKQVAELYNIGRRVDPNAPTTDEYLMNDYGQRTLYFYDSETDKKVMCYSYGDSEKLSSDKNANLFKEKWDSAKGTGLMDSYEIMSLIPKSDIYFRDYPSDGLKITGNYILFDKRQLSVLAEKCGVPIDGILDDMDEYRADDSVFFAELTKSSRPADGIMKYGDTYDFVYLYEDEEPLCHVAAYPRDSGDFTLTEYKNFSGEVWQVLPDFDPNFDSRVISGYTYGASDDALGRIFSDSSMNNLWGIMIDSKEGYDEFVSRCDSLGVFADGSVADRFEERMKPDFDNYILCVKFQRRDEGQTYEQHRMTVNRGRIDLGDNIVPRHDRYIGFIDGTVTWLWLPVDYIDKEANYSVS